MRPIISMAEANELINRLPEIKESINNHTRTADLKKQYNALLGTHDCEAFFQVIKGIYLKKQQRNRLGSTGQLYMQKAENILYGELAAALEIPKSSVVSYIENAVAKIESTL